MCLLQNIGFDLFGGNGLLVKQQLAEVNFNGFNAGSFYPLQLFLPNKRGNRNLDEQLAAISKVGDQVWLKSLLRHFFIHSFEIPPAGLIYARRPSARHRGDL
ncbi:hypothetical protein G039_0332470 [Pseudomonas aeruginosa VRFPA01]|nr:hypothetical protein G039_0332470 [Pseudomonas aeruginosa VRFPA01]